MPIRPSSNRRWFGAVLCLALAACAPPPVFRPATPPLDVDAETVAHAPDRYHDGEVIWGGRVVEVRNRADATELVVLSYPLDGGQRPRPKENSNGRFIVVLPGYVERYDYPEGCFISVAGKLRGSLAGKIDGQDYVYPLVKSDSMYLWPPGFERHGPQIHFGIGIRGAIR